MTSWLRNTSIGSNMHGLASLALLATVSSVSATDIFVDASATSGSNNGTSWPNAYLDLQDALTQGGLSGSDRILVAAGTFTPGSSSSDTFLLRDDVDLYGGFPTGGADFEDRDPDANPTILSGDNSGNDDPQTPSTFSDNSLNVVTAIDTTAALTRLDGFTITKGRGGSGAGLRVVKTPTLGTARLNVTRCRFLDNDAINSSGGAVALSNTLQQANLDVMFTNCEFIGNAASSGGAIYFHQGAAPACTVAIMACLIADVARTIAVLPRRRTQPVIFTVELDISDVVHGN